MEKPTENLIDGSLASWPDGGGTPSCKCSCKETSVFTDEILQKYADVLIWGLKTARESTGGRYQEEDIVSVLYQKESTNLAEYVHKSLLEEGIIPLMEAGKTAKMEADFYRLASEEHLKFLGPWRKVMYKMLNGRMNLLAPSSLTHLKDVDPKKIAAISKKAKALGDIATKREEQGLFGWTLCMMPTMALAEEAKMSLNEYSKEIIRACYLDKPNPVKEWENLKKEAEEIKIFLNRLDVKYFHVESENTNLKITPGDQRRWLGVSGHNIPSFELFTSPDWRGTEGWYYANMPSLRSGNYVKGVRLAFKKGRVIKIEAEEGEEFTKKQLEIDKGASQIGEFSLTDKRFSPIRKFMASTLFDENVGGEFGNCHVAVGASFSDTHTGDPRELTKKKKKELGFNDSALHWDLITTEDRKVIAYLKGGGRKVIYENGMFQY